MLGGSTPILDRIANEGAIFTDACAQQSCTAGRASFILGQHPFRTGLLTTGAGLYVADLVHARYLTKTTSPGRAS